MKRETQKFITSSLVKKCYIITYWLNIKELTYGVYIVIYIEVKRNILTLCHGVLKLITIYVSISYNVFKGCFLT